MAGELSQNVIKRVIRQVGLECATRGQSLSETLVAFMVKAVVLDPRNDFSMDRVFTENDVQNLTQLCVTRLLDTTNPSLNTIKMQVYFDMNYANRAELLSEQRRVLEGKVAPLVRAITESSPRAQEEMENLYQRIVTYVLLSSGLGSPRDFEAVREATAALQSVFSLTEMITFISHSKKDKEQQLKDFAMLVTGIRLYNKECQKGGSGIDDLPAILNEAIPSATQTVDEYLISCHLLAYRYTALLESMQGDRYRHSQLYAFKLKEALFNFRQYEAFLCILLSDVITSAREVESLNVQFEAAMMILKNTMQDKTSIDSKEVFPLFVELSKLWTSYQDERLLLSFLTNMIDNLQQFSEIQSQHLPERMLTSLLEGVTVKSDEERIKETMGTRVNVSDFRNQEWLFPETADNFEQLLIQYHGFCAHSIGVKGLTLPGSFVLKVSLMSATPVHVFCLPIFIEPEVWEENIAITRTVYDDSGLSWTMTSEAKSATVLELRNPAIGILKHKQKCYVFSSKEAAYIFAQDPDKFIQLNIEKAKEYAELIQLLELRHQFEYLVPHAQASNAIQCSMKPPPKCDTSTQTDTHILPPTIVRSYEWNEWELRRKAIKLANLRRKLTHAMQTDLSHMRRETFTQVYFTKEIGTQTKRDNSSNVPKPQIYLKGLRGGSSPTTHMVTVDLTRPLDET